MSILISNPASTRGILGQNATVTLGLIQPKDPSCVVKEPKTAQPRRDKFRFTEFGERGVPRLRESRILTTSGRGGEVRNLGTALSPNSVNVSGFSDNGANIKGGRTQNHVTFYRGVHHLHTCNCNQSSAVLINGPCTIFAFAYRGDGGLGDQSEDHLPANRSVSRLPFWRILIVISGFDLAIFVTAILQFAHLDGQRLNYDEAAR